MTEKLTENQINSWTTLVRTQQYLLNQVEADLKKAGYPPLAWYDVLLELKSAPDGRLRLNEMGARMLLEKSNLTRLVDRMENDSLLIREACDADKRGAYAVITAEGRALQKRMWVIYARSLRTHFTSKVTLQEADVLLKLLRKLGKESVGSGN